MEQLQSFKFEKLIVWQKAMEFGEQMNMLADTFPVKERFNLADQLRRASDSVALNIAEGAILQSQKENQKFLGYGIRSLAETVTCLHKALNRRYLSEDIFRQHYLFSFNLMNMLVAFRNKVN